MISSSFDYYKRSAGSGAHVLHNIHIGLTEEEFYRTYGQSKEMARRTIEAFHLMDCPAWNKSMLLEAIKLAQYPYTIEITDIQRINLPTGGNQKIAMNALAELLKDSKEFNKDGAPDGSPCIRLEDALSLISARLVCDQKRRKERATNALTALCAKGIYGTNGEWIWRI